MPVVIDTNVLVIASAGPEADHERSHVPIKERLTVLQWLEAFRKDTDATLVLDRSWLILSEARGALGQQDFGLQVLLEKMLWAEWVDIADLPPELDHAVHDADDHKFVQASLALEPHPPIVNASDTDWLDCEQALEGAGVEVIQLIPKWLRASRAAR